MDSPKYLIIVTLVDGQNFTLPDGAPDKLDASVFAEARFGNESFLKSDPIKLTNSNPEFVTELAWQLDKKSLHQLRVERRAIKLQIFLQTKDRKKSSRRLNNSDEQPTSNGTHSSGDTSGEAHKVELIGYTVLDLRSAQETDHPKFHWLPLLNPKFRKSTYNRPEVQIALTLHRIEENSGVITTSTPSTSVLPRPNMKTDLVERAEAQSESLNSSNFESLTDNQLYKTCLDFTTNHDRVENDEIIENDIRIRSKNGSYYIYDAKDPTRSTIYQCFEPYKITITIPFSSDLDLIVDRSSSYWYFSVGLFGSSKRSENFTEINSVEIKQVEFDVFTSRASVLAKYFELNSDLVIKIHQANGESLGVATIQLDQLCSLDTKSRSIEGIFALQSMSDHESPSTIHPTVGVSVVLDKIDWEEVNQRSKENSIEKQQAVSSQEGPHPEHNDQQLNITTEKDILIATNNDIEMAKEHFGEDINELFININDTNQVTYDSNFNSDMDSSNDVVNVEQEQDDHHYCFTIDLKKFSYSPSQRLIPTLRELVVRYSYPFFGYKDTITTETSIPINANNSIIVSGFCEFNFATTFTPLITALREIPLNLDILTCDDTTCVNGATSSNYGQRLVATCCVNLAETLGLDETSADVLSGRESSTTVSVSIFGLDGDEIGDLQLYLCIRDLGRPSYDFKASVDNLNECTGDDASQQEHKLPAPNVPIETSSEQTIKKIEDFIGEAKTTFEGWKEDFSKKVIDEIRARETERYKRITQRLEAKDARREQEFKKKMDELTILEKRYKTSLTSVETLEKKLSDHLERLQTKDSLLDTKLDTIDLKISQAVSRAKMEHGRNSKTAPEISLRGRRSSFENSKADAGIPLPVRGSLDFGQATKLVKRPVGVVTSVVNGVSTRARSQTAPRISLSKATQEKLISLRKEKAELLKRGCRPNDELIQEINSMIEKLVY